QESVREFQVSGGYTARVTPVPIPNTEVKPRRADDTARATVWERRSPPGLNYKRPLAAIRAAFLFAFCLLRPEDGISGPHWPGQGAVEKVLLTSSISGTNVKASTLDPALL